jgi:hypothetical protein
VRHRRDPSIQTVDVDSELSQRTVDGVPWFDTDRRRLRPVRRIASLVMRLLGTISCADVAAVMDDYCDGFLDPADDGISNSASTTYSERPCCGKGTAARHSNRDASWTRISTSSDRSSRARRSSSIWGSSRKSMRSFTLMEHANRRDCGDEQARELSLLRRISEVLGDSLEFIERSASSASGFACRPTNCTNVDSAASR